MLTCMRKSMFSSLAILTKPNHSPLQNNHVFVPTHETIPSTLQSYINSDNPFPGKKIHALVLKSGLILNTNIHIKLLILHLKCGSLNYARQVFDEMPRRTLTSYNYMISGYLKRGLVEDSLGLVRRLVLSGERPDGFTFSMILKASASTDCRHAFLGKIAHARMIRLGTCLDDVICTALVDSYIKNGCVSSARRVYDSMSERDIVCSTSMITGCMNLSSFEDAEEIFRSTVDKDLVVFNAMIEGYSRSSEHAVKSFEIYVEMQRFGFRPNISTFSSVIGACSMLAAYEFGQQVQTQIMKTELFAHVKISSALIDMYSKFGRVEEAKRIFDHTEKNVFSWTSMIDGYGKSGFAYEALELFRTMCGRERNIVEPNHVTFLSALTACSHAGIVDEGQRIFEMMKRDYGLEPKIEHYVCMVDLYGRSGDLDRAWDLARAMPMKPNSDVWTALLSSCRLHGNTVLADMVANELAKLNIDHRSGAYVQMSNTLADAGKWDRVSELREAMNVRGVSKGKGSSWVSGDSSL